MLAGTHADVEVVNTRKLSIGVDDARALVSRAAPAPVRRALAGDRRRGRRPAHRPGRQRAAQGDRGADAAHRVAALRPEPSTTSCPRSGPAAATCRCVRRRPPPSPRCWSGATASTRRWRAFAARAAQGHIGRARRLATDEDARLRRHRGAAAAAVAARSSAAALRAAGDLVDAATAEAAEQAATLATSRGRGACARALGVGAGGRQPAGAAAASSRSSRASRRSAPRGPSATRSTARWSTWPAFYRDVLAVQAGAGVELVNEEMRDAVAGVGPVVDARGDAAPDRRDPRRRTAIDANVAPLLAVEAMTVALRRG